MNKYLTVAFYAIGQSVLQLAVLIALTRLLDPKDIGFYALVTLTTSISRLGMSGVVPAIIKADDLSALATASASLFLSYLLSMALFFIGGGYLLINKAVGLEYFYCYFYAVIIFLVQALSMPYEALLIRSGKQSFLVKYELKNFIFINMPASLLMAYYSFGMHALLFPQLIGFFVRYIALKKYSDVALSFKYDILIIRNLVSFNLASLLNYFSTQADKYFVSAFYSIDVLGIYSRGSQVFQFAAGLYSKVIGYVCFPRFASEQDTHERNIYFNRAYVISYVFVLTVSFIFWLPMEMFFKFLLGEKWSATAEILGILIVFMPARLNYKLSDYYVMATNSLKVYFLFQIFYAIFVLLLLTVAYVNSVNYVELAVLVCVSVLFYSVLIGVYSFFITKAVPLQYCLVMLGALSCLLIYILSVFMGKVSAYFYGLVMLVAVYGVLFFLRRKIL